MFLRTYLTTANYPSNPPSLRVFSHADWWGHHPLPPTCHVSLKFHVFLVSFVAAAPSPPNRGSVASADPFLHDCRGCCCPPALPWPVLVRHGCCLVPPMYIRGFFVVSFVLWGSCTSVKGVSWRHAQGDSESLAIRSKEFVLQPKIFWRWNS